MTADDQAVPAGGPGPLPKRFEKYFAAMMKAGASDLHLVGGKPPHIRIHGAIQPTQAKPLTPEEIERMVFELVSESQWARFAEGGNMDLAYEIAGSDRFRLNAFRQRGTIAVAVRRVSREIPDFETLHLPPAVRQVAEGQQGLVLLSGPTGCGKSTTIAAMLEHINKTRPCHIITLEDPIEYLYESKKALVSQREIGIDVEDFATGLKYLMREDPDVVLIGEMRDPATFQAALQASETGHMVFGTVHASGAAQTLGRILDLFPADVRESVRLSLAFNLRAIICQKLLPCITSDTDRIPAVEMLINNPSARQMIMEQRDSELIEVMLSHEIDGMQTFNSSLLQLIESGMIDPRDAYDNAPNVEELKMLMKGISASRVGLRG